jgi:hypothetical protein
LHNLRLSSISIFKVAGLRQEVPDSRAVTRKDSIIQSADFMPSTYPGAIPALCRPNLSD